MRRGRHVHAAQHARHPPRRARRQQGPSQRTGRQRVAERRVAQQPPIEQRPVDRICALDGCSARLGTASARFTTVRSMAWTRQGKASTASPAHSRAVVCAGGPAEDNAALHRLRTSAGRWGMPGPTRPAAGPRRRIGGAPRSPTGPVGGLVPAGIDRSHTSCRQAAHAQSGPQRLRAAGADGHAGRACNKMKRNGPHRCRAGRAGRARRQPGAAKAPGTGNAGRLRRPREPARSGGRGNRHRRRPPGRAAARRRRTRRRGSRPWRPHRRLHGPSARLAP